MAPTEFIELVRGEAEPLLKPPAPPANLLPSIERWIRGMFWIEAPYEWVFQTELLRDVERKMNVKVRFDPSSDEAALTDLLERVGRSEDFAITWPDPLKSVRPV